MKIKYIGTDNSFGIGTAVFKHGDIKDVLNKIGEIALIKYPNKFELISRDLNEQLHMVDEEMVDEEMVDEEMEENRIPNIEIQTNIIGEPNPTEITKQFKRKKEGA